MSTVKKFTPVCAGRTVTGDWDPLTDCALAMAGTSHSIAASPSAAEVRVISRKRKLRIRIGFPWPHSRFRRIDFIGVGGWVLEAQLVGHTRGLRRAEALPIPTFMGDREEIPAVEEEGFTVTPGEVRGNTVVLRARGRLDAKGVPILLEAAAAVQAGRRNLVVNLGEITFIGSSGVGSLLVLVERFQEHAVFVRYAVMPPKVSDVIKLLNLDKFLSIDATEQESIAALEG